MKTITYKIFTNLGIVRGLFQDIESLLLSKIETKNRPDNFEELQTNLEALRTLLKKKDNEFLMIMAIIEASEDGQSIKSVTNSLYEDSGVVLVNTEILTVKEGTFEICVFDKRKNFYFSSFVTNEMFVRYLGLVDSWMIK